ncbi:MAG: hypothetical protein K9I47_10510, partial [Bacteroidales bacterium]|nr:hypothetical protein [Bacteroidales bacterium]
MYFKIYFLALFSFLLSHSIFGQGETCEDAQPICSDSSYQFYSPGLPNEIPDYYSTTCLDNTPGPAWFYFQIEDPGDIEIVMTGYEADVANPETLDIDFACWGPFDSYEVCGDNGYLVEENEVDCSYLPAHTEYCNITDANSGDYYILLITNFAEVPAIIEFYQESGDGSTNCFIVDVNATSNSPVCQGDSIHLTANEIDNAT